MSNTKGFGLTARLIAKHFGTLGNKIAETIANFDPETATEVDRDNLANSLRESSVLLAKARTEFSKEHDDVVRLQELIRTDELAFDTLAARLQEGTITEATVNMFCDELEANKAKLAVEIAEEAQAKEYLDEIQAIVTSLSEQLQQFDAHAKKVLTQLKMANAQKEVQEMKLARQSELASFKGIQNQSSALSALSRKAEAMSAEAEGLKIVAELNQKPLDQQAAIDEIRKSVSSNASPTETALDRLKRLSSANNAAA